MGPTGVRSRANVVAPSLAADCLLSWPRVGLDVLRLLSSLVLLLHRRDGIGGGWRPGGRSHLWPGCARGLYDLVADPQPPVRRAQTRIAGTVGAPVAPLARGRAVTAKTRISNASWTEDQDMLGNRELRGSLFCIALLVAGCAKPTGPTDQSAADAPSPGPAPTEIQARSIRP